METNETRETFRAYIVNDRATWEGIESYGRLLACNCRAVIEWVNRKHAPQIGGGSLIDTEADKRAAIAAYLAEVDEIVTWELIGKGKAQNGPADPCQLQGPALR